MFRSLLDQVGLDTAHLELEQLYQQAQSGQTALQNQEHVLSSLEVKFNALEYRLIKREEEFVASAETFASSVQEIPTAIRDPPLAILPPSEHNETASTTHPLLAEYYDRKGDIAVYLERLQEFVEEHQEALGRRDLAKDQDQVLEISDEQFQQDFEQARELLENDYEKALQDTDRLGKLCQKQGIEIPIPTPSSPGAISTQDPRWSRASLSSGVASMPLVTELRPWLSEFPRPESMPTDMHSQISRSAAKESPKVRTQTWLFNMGKRDPSELHDAESPATTPISKPDLEEPESSGLLRRHAENLALSG
ncbi:hypothetical protein MBLNU230_g3132t1 [Neophaeotheca triangularis]